MPETLSCPNCNAPLNYDGHSFTIVCDYCSTQVIVPADLRRAPLKAPPSPSPADVQAIWTEIQELARAGKKIPAIARLHETFDVDLKTAKEAVERLADGQAMSYTSFDLRLSRRPQVMDTATSERIRSMVEAGEKIEAIKLYRQVMDVSLKEAVAAVDAMQLGFQVLQDHPAPPPVARRPVDVAAQTGVNKGLSLIGCWIGIAIILLTLIPVLIALTATGGPLYEPWAKINPFAEEHLLLTFGGEGTGPGLFQDARYVATDNQGHIFIGEYDTGRIHIFDLQGKFLSQWTAVNESDHTFYLRGMAVDRGGRMYLSAQGKVYLYQALTGELQAQLQPPSEHAYFDDVYLAQDGTLYAVDTYDGDHILRFDRNGQVTLNLRNAVSTISGKSEATLRLAVDGLGTIYALSLQSEHIYIFSPNGRYLNRFGGEGDEEGQFTSSYAIAVDNQSRIFASDHGGLLVFASDGRYLDKLRLPVGYIDGLCFDDQNRLYTVSNDQQVRLWEIK